MAAGGGMSKGGPRWVHLRIWRNFVPALVCGRSNGNRVRLTDRESEVTCPRCSAVLLGAGGAM